MSHFFSKTFYIHEENKFVHKLCTKHDFLLNIYLSIIKCDIVTNKKKYNIGFNLLVTLYVTPMSLFSKIDIKRVTKNP